MAVKHLNFAGKSAVGQRPMGRTVAREKKPLATMVKKTQRVAATPKTTTLSPTGGGKVGGQVFKSGGGYTSNPTYGKGLGVSTPAKKNIGKVKGH